MQLPAGDLRVDVAVRQEDVFPSVIIEVEENSPKAEVLPIDSKSGREAGVMEGSVSVIAVERRYLVGEVGTNDIEPTVAVVVANPDTHARHSRAILVEGATRRNADLAERAVVIISIEQTRSRVARDIDVRPAVVVEVGGCGAHSVRSYGPPVP